MWCCPPKGYASDLRTLVPSWSWSGHASSQAIVPNNLLLYPHYLMCTKLNTMVKKWLISQPTVIIAVTD